jgi:ferredoxin-NADP reductase
MLRHLSQNNESYELHYSVKTDKDLAFKAEIVGLAGNNVHFYCTKGNSVEGMLPTRLDINSLIKENNKASHVYICGPIKMIEAAKDAADENNWQPGHVHYESFGSSPTGKRSCS